MRYEAYRRRIESLYTDKCTIIRRKLVYDNELHSETMQDVVIHENVKCRISQKNLGIVNQTETVNNISYETKLFISPDLEILQGDKIIVTRQYERDYVAGEPFAYETHQEISLQRKEYA